MTGPRARTGAHDLAGFGAAALDGVAAADLAARWGVPRVSYERIIPSSMDRIHALAATGAPAATVALCDEQTAGRGRDGRTWHSPPGGVWLAALYRPPVAGPGTLAIRIGLAVAVAVDEVLGAVRAELKWPNDVYLDGRKLGGILCEGRWKGDRLEHLCAGIGINVRNAIPAGLRDRAIALEEVRPDVTRLEVLDRLVPALAALGAGAGPLSERELAAFAARDRLRGRRLRAPVAGVGRGVAPDGALLVETAAGTIAVREGRIDVA